MPLTRDQDLDINKVTHDKLKKRDTGAKSIAIKYDNDYFRVQIKKVRVPYGVSVYPNEKNAAKDVSPTEPKKYSLEVSLGGSETMDKFREVLEDIDELNLSYCSANSKAWWGKAMSAEVMKEAETYKSHVKPDNKGENPPRLKLKLPFYDNKPAFKVFGVDKKEINIVTKDETGEYVTNWDWARSGMEIKVIAECEGLWVINKNIYCTWKAVQIQVLDKGVDMRRSFAFIEDDEEVEAAPKSEAKKAAAPKEESDEEYVEEEEYVDEEVEEDA
jgi:hypothetical protein